MLTNNEASSLVNKASTAIWSGDTDKLQHLIVSMQALDATTTSPSIKTINIPRKVDGKTLLHRAVEKNLVARPEILGMLLAAGANEAVNTQDKLGLTPLAYAAITNHPMETLTLLEIGADINAQDNTDKTSLHHAASETASAALEMLIYQGADLNVIDNENKTALHYAASKNHTIAIKMLIRAGASATIKDMHGRTAREYAIAINATDAIAAFDTPVGLPPTSVRSESTVTLPRTPNDMSVIPSPIGSPVHNPTATPSPASRHASIISELSQAPIEVVTASPRAISEDGISPSSKKDIPSARSTPAHAFHPITSPAEIRAVSPSASPRRISPTIAPALPPVAPPPAQRSLFMRVLMGALLSLAAIATAALAIVVYPFVAAPTLILGFKGPLNFMDGLLSILAKEWNSVIHGDPISPITRTAPSNSDDATHVPTLAPLTSSRRSTARRTPSSSQSNYASTPEDDHVFALDRHSTATTPS